MIAMPVKTNKKIQQCQHCLEKRNISLLYQKYFEIVKDEQSGGRAVDTWLKSKNVDTIITSHMEKNHFLNFFKIISIYILQVMKELR